MNLGKNLKKLRKQRGLSQAELGKKVGCHLTHINRIETEKYIPSLEITTKIANLFGVSLDDLVYKKSDLVLGSKIKESSLDEKISSLDSEEKKAIYKIIDSIISKKYSTSTE